MIKAIVVLSTLLLLLNSCYFVPAKSYDKHIRDRSFNMGIDKLHQQSIENNNLDSVYCNLTMVMETLAYFRTELKELKFSNKGLQKVKDELTRSYEKYKSGDRNFFKSELELKDSIGQYIKWVIDDAKSGDKNYEVSGIFDLKPTPIPRKK